MSSAVTERERRQFTGEFEIRNDAEGATKRMTGYAAKFDALSENLGTFRERIRRGAFEPSIRSADVRLLVNHEGMPLARTKSGTLKLFEDSIGLRFEAKLDASDPDVQRLIPKMKRGDLTQMSFGFFTKRDSWDRSDPQRPVRILEEVEIFDISIVTFPAYPQTEAEVRRPPAWQTAGHAAASRARKLKLWKNEIDATRPINTAERSAHLRRLKLSWVAPSASHGGRGAR